MDGVPGAAEGCGGPRKDRVEPVKIDWAFGDFGITVGGRDEKRANPYKGLSSITLSP